MISTEIFKKSIL